MLTNRGKTISLSFDNGPDPEVTPLVLDVLARRGIRTTFFVVGSKLAAARAASERAHAEGHWIGNHTWSHSTPFRDRGDIEFVTEEIDRTQQEIGNLAHGARFFRPFGGQGRLEGALNGTAAGHLAANGFTCVMWNAVPGDWKDHDGWPAVAVEQIVSQETPLVVLHDIHLASMRHLDRFLGTLLDGGHAFQQSFPADCIAIDCGRPTDVLAKVAQN